MTGRAPIAVALDTPDLATATAWAAAVAPYVSTLKVGLELFDRYGHRGVTAVRAAAPSARLFLDVKLHDIPATVAGAARALAPLEPEFVTVHCLGGPAMIEAAVDALPATRIAGVTVLTSMSAADLDAVGIAGVPLDAVRGSRGWRLMLALAPWSARRRRWPRSAPRSARTSSSSHPAYARRRRQATTRHASPPRSRPSPTAPTCS